MMLTEEKIRQAFEKARDWFKKKIPDLAAFADEPSLVFVNSTDGWDIRPFPSRKEIHVNLWRIKWHLDREKAIKLCPKYDIETALIHDLFEYCYLRKWNYPENDPAIVGLTHSKAKALENALRSKRGLSDWI